MLLCVMFGGFISAQFSIHRPKDLGARTLEITEENRPNLDLAGSSHLAAVKLKLALATLVSVREVPGCDYE